MKILAIAAELDIDKYSCSLCNAGILRTLEETFDVSVITEYKGKNNFGFTGKFQNADKPFLLDLTFWKWKAVRYIIAKSGFYPPETLRTTALTRAVEKELAKQDYDVIIALGSGSWFYPHYILGKLPTKAKKWAFIHDPFPSNVYPEPYTSHEKTNAKEIKKLQKAINTIDRLWFPSELLANHMANWYRFKGGQVFVFPHIMFDKPISKPEELNLPLVNNSFYLHTGNLLKPRKIHGIVQAFKELKKEGLLPKEKKLVFIGPAQYSIDGIADEDVLVVNRRVTYDTAMDLSNKAEKLIIIESDGEESPFLPGKVPQYISMQKPILHFGPTNSEVNRIFSMDGSEEIYSAPLFDIERIKLVFLSSGFVFQNSEKAKAHWNKKRLFQTLSR